MAEHRSRGQEHETGRVLGQGEVQDECRQDPGEIVYQVLEAEASTPEGIRERLLHQRVHADLAQEEADSHCEAIREIPTLMIPPKASIPAPPTISAPDTIAVGLTRSRRTWASTNPTAARGPHPPR